MHSMLLPWQTEVPHVQALTLAMSPVEFTQAARELHWLVAELQVWLGSAHEVTPHRQGWGLV